MAQPGPESPGEPRPPPPELSDFDILREIGQGGFGQVWLARNRTTGHLRAVKVIPLCGTAAFDRAGREVSALARLEARVRRQHPNLVTIHHVGKTRECVYYVMDPADDLAGGRASAAETYRPATLQDRLAAGPMPPDDCLRCARQLLAGLASLHEAGMVHRDVKPANCLFIDGDLKLADFGLVTDASPQVSRIGTAGYMPPDGRMDARADVYAAGLVIYEMLTGMPADRFPQLGDRDREVVGDSTLCRLVRLVLHAAHPDPQTRHADAGAMLADLMSPASARHGDGGVSRRRVLWIAAAAALTAGAAAALVWITRTPQRTAAKPRRAVGPDLRRWHELLDALPAEYAIRLEDGKHTPVEVQNAPILRWAEETRLGDSPGRDAATYLGVADGRPQMVVCAFPMSAAGDRVRLDFQSLAEGPLVAQRRGEVVWSPVEPGVVFRPVPDAPPPAGSAHVRTEQMNRIAQRFDCAACVWRDDANGWEWLDRLGSLRYASAAAGIVDGVVIAFCRKTDPEALLLLEAVAQDGTLRWRYAFARRYSGLLAARYDGQPVWEVDEQNCPRDRSRARIEFDHRLEVVERAGATE